MITTQPGSEDEGKGTRSNEGNQVGSIEGLEALIPLEGVMVEQKVELIEVVTSYESKNEYDIKTLPGMSVFHVAEHSNICCRNCNGRRRGFTMSVTDFKGNTVAQFRRPCKCCCCNWMMCASFYCCTDWIHIEVPPDNKVGKVRQRSSNKLSFNVNDENGRFAYISGPTCCGLGCCTACLRQKKFRVLWNDGSELGMITKLFGGVVKEFLSDADTFRVTFPPELSVIRKMILIGAVILIDFIAFEDNEGKKAQANN
ncbi:hypothetical protein GCK32_003989 [Trichostrongylus colubriformis]|uniref:Phospholipid scramblase n=1 Tax=Trichostrongylus colubriformis TaxID=6319 RepID=A0AAN8FTZ3_TRICO